MVAGRALAQKNTRVLLPSAQLSFQKLEKITAYFNQQVASGKIAGANLLIQRHAIPIYSRSFGKTDVTTREPMRPEAIFRLHSLSKPITSVSAMLLIDEGRMNLDDPLAQYIPAFANAKVGVEGKSDNGEPILTLEPVHRPITIRDLLRHSSGITYGFYGKSMVRSAYANAALFAPSMDNAELAEKIASLPLAEQPGEVWDYGHSTDVLGRVIEVVSGKSLYDFQKARLFGQLGMADTAYYVADPAKYPLIANALPSDSDFRTGHEPDPKIAPKYQSGGGGLLSTTGDLARFCQMILNGGSLDGTLYLKPDTFSAMVQDQVVPRGPVRKGDYYFPGDGFGFGLGFAIRSEQGQFSSPGSPGELKWDGAGGEYFWVDRQQDMFVILLMQSPSERGRIHADLKAMVYDAFENPLGR
ncbi:MAG: beta-lactamase family protein [Xanthobacteraceae bacterium]|nr:beta-lactamase family protein [Xanthobacteraceae bacterium]